MSRRRRAILGGVVVVGALGYLLATGLGDNLVYYLTPTELLAKGPEAYGASLRLSGRVVPGSVQWTGTSRDLRFRVQDDSTTVPVESTGLPPDMFHDGIDVVLEGSLASSGVFHATTLMVKHSNEYQPGRRGEPAAQRFRTLTAAGGGS